MSLMAGDTESTSMDFRKVYLINHSPNRLIWKTATKDLKNQYAVTLISLTLILFDFDF